MDDSVKIVDLFNLIAESLRDGKLSYSYLAGLQHGALLSDVLSTSVNTAEIQSAMNCRLMIDRALDKVERFNCSASDRENVRGGAVFGKFRQVPVIKRPGSEN